jgi:hypothetical protein
MKKSTFCFILIFYIFPLSFISAKPDNSSKPEEFVSDFLFAKMNILVTKEVDSIDKYYSIQPACSQKYMLFTKKEILQDYLISYASNDYDIKKVAPEVKIISSSIKNNFAAIEATLKTDIYWNASNALGTPIIAMKFEKHKFILNKENGNWRIISDQYSTSRGYSDEFINEDISKLTDTIEKLKKEAKISINRAKKSKPSRLTIAVTEPQANNNCRYKLLAADFTPHHSTKAILDNDTSLRIKNLSTQYNRNNAFNWAYTYWDNYSTEYVNLGDEKWKGGDCTNFVSQCLRAGGAANDRIGSYQWYYENNGSKKVSDASFSWTWSTARGLNYIILGNYNSKEFGPKGTEKVITGDSEYNTSIGSFIALGDIIQYQWKQNDKIGHSAIIVGILYNSSKQRYEPVIAEHTNNSWYTPWTNNAYKTYFVHIESVN